MTPSAFSVPSAQRYFEDYEPGLVYEFGSVVMTEEEILDFARKYDPQTFHTDPVLATRGRFGGLIASGWHTIGVAMRLLVEHYLSHTAAMASPGVDEVRWTAPVRPGDTLRVRVSTLEARPSRNKPDRGVIKARIEALNQRDEVVMSMLAMCIMGRRPAEGTDEAK
jgi:acyl dehydratase